MKAYIQVKQVGKRKCSIEKMPIDFPTPPASVQELIEAVVCWQVKEYNERLQQSEMLKYLTCEEMEDKAAAGKVGFEANYNGRPAVETEPSSMLCNRMKTESSASFWTMRNSENYPPPSN